MVLTQALRDWAFANGVSKNASDEQIKAAVLDALANGKLTQAKFSELLKDTTTNTATKVVFDAVKAAMGSSNPLFANGVRVKDASESYSTTKTVAKHARTGREVLFCGKAVETPSALELAKLGALMKLYAMKGGAAVVLTEHERGLIQDSIEKDVWHGSVNGIEVEKAAPEMVKSLVYDSVSGGVYLTPAFFDDLIVTFPLLHSELMPRVDTVDVPRGAYIMGGSLANPAVQWSFVDGVAMTEFDTANIAQALNTVIFPVTCYCTVGRDFLSDVPVDAGAYLVNNIGQSLLKDLDRVIAVGDGVQQPQGITNATGLTAVASDMSTSGPATVGDYESLMFAIGKQYRNADLEPCYFANDTSYRRARGIPVGPADERRVFGLDEASYSLLDRPYLIQNDLGNSTIGFGALKKYRLYRRLGSSVNWIENTDTYLASRNLAAVIVRARFGGRVLDPNAFALISDGQA